MGRNERLSDLFVRASGNRISEQTQIVIEGFPRSGNTFLVTAFVGAQPGFVSVAHHRHVPAQVVQAVRLGIPCLVLIREPRDAVRSLVVRLPHLSVRQALRSYLRFYEPLLPMRQRFVVASFDQVTTDLGAVIDRVNERFGTSFQRFEHTPERVDAVLAEVDASDRGAFRDDEEAMRRSRARPSPDRERMKDALAGAYDAERLWSLRLRADRVYELFTAEP